MFCFKKTSQVRPHDGLWSWVVCVCATLSQALIVGFGLSIGVVLPALMSDFNTTREKVAWVGSIAMSLVSLLGPLSGPLSDRFGCRVMSISGALICSLALGLSSLVNHVELLYLTYGVLFGTGSNFVYTPGILVISEYFTKWRSLALSLVMAGLFVGVLICGPCLQLLLTAFGWRGTFRIMAGVVCVAVLLGCTYIPNKGGEPKEETSKNNKVKSSDNTLDNNSETDCVVTENETGDLPQHDKGVCEEKKKKKKKFIDFSVWKRPLYAVTVISSTLAFFSQYIPKVNVPAYARDLGIPADAAADLFIYLGVASIVSLLISGALISTSWMNEQYLYQASLLGNGLATVLLPHITSYNGLIPYIIAYGACDGVFILLMSVLVFKSVDEETRAGALGMQQCFTAVALLVGLPFAGWIADLNGSYKPAFYMGGSISIMAGLSVFVLLCLKPKKVSSELENIVATIPENNVTNPGYIEEEQSLTNSEGTKSAEGASPDLRKRTASST